jgi:hypothetical protein
MIADKLNSFRVVPRLMMFSYMALLIHSYFWFTELTDPTSQQVAFASAILAAGAGWFTIYVNSGGTK